MTQAERLATIVVPDNDEGAPSTASRLTKDDRALNDAFRVQLEATARAEPASGRLIVLLVREGSKVPPESEPVEGPFWDDPQPLFGIDVKLAPGGEARVDDAADAFPVKPSALAPGTYRAQARFDIQRADSSWRREPGNLWSDAVSFTVGAPNSVNGANAAEQEGIAELIFTGERVFDVTEGPVIRQDAI